MKGVDEVHLLNITVAPAFQRQGWAPLMLEALAGWSRGAGRAVAVARSARQQPRALDVYERNGFRRVGVRKGYYPALRQPARGRDRHEPAAQRIGQRLGRSCK